MKRNLTILLATLLTIWLIYGLFLQEDVTINMTVHLDDGSGTPPTQTVTITSGSTTTSLTSGSSTKIDLTPQQTYKISSSGFKNLSITTTSINRLTDLTLTLRPSGDSSNKISGQCSSSSRGEISVLCGNRVKVNSGKPYTVDRKSSSGEFPLLQFLGKESRKVELKVEPEVDSDRAKIDVAFDDSSSGPVLPRGFLRIWFANWFAG